MEIIDVKKLEVAIEYIKRMSEGNNPINNQKLPEDSELNNLNIIRCLYFVEDVLKKVYNNKGYIGRIPKKEKEKFPLEVLEEFQYRKDLSIAHLVKQINEPLQDKNAKKISYGEITKWLMLSGYLKEDISNKNNKKIKLPTQSTIFDITYGSNIVGRNTRREYK